MARSQFNQKLWSFILKLINNPLWGIKNNKLTFNKVLNCCNVNVLTLFGLFWDCKVLKIPISCLELKTGHYEQCEWPFLVNNRDEVPVLALWENTARSFLDMYISQSIQKFFVHCWHPFLKKIKSVNATSYHSWHNQLNTE